MEVLLAGGGLAGCLMAWRLAARGCRVRIVEAADRLGGNHTWSCHDSDVSPVVLRWLEPLAVQRWTGSEVRFPGLDRRLPGRYLSFTSDELHVAVSAEQRIGLQLGVAITDLDGHSVRLADGTELTADLVIDGRGAGRMPGLSLGWQKFLGREIVLRRPHGITMPLLMDATVEQLDGYRFVYVLPFDPHRLLVEDTSYSDAPGLDRERLGAQLRDYVAGRGWEVAETVREEAGILPIVLDGDPEAFWPATDRVPRAGLRAGLFHHTTGYSLPEAAALAEDLAALLAAGSRGPDEVADWIRARFLAHWQRQGFFRQLNRLLFRAAEPGERWRVLRHFYRLPPETIARFYAGRPTLGDRLRILSGRPPVPVRRALQVLAGSRP